MSPFHSDVGDVLFAGRDRWDVGRGDIGAGCSERHSWTGREEGQECCKTRDPSVLPSVGLYSSLTAVAGFSIMGPR